MDSAGGLYFAQARRYDAGAGRFVSEDFFRGLAAVPYTLNHYNYCWNRPLDLVDLNGMWPQWIETTVKAVTVVAVGAVVVGTGGRDVFLRNTSPNNTSIYYYILSEKFLIKSRKNPVHDLACNMIFKKSLDTLMFNICSKL